MPHITCECVNVGLVDAQKHLYYVFYVTGVKDYVFVKGYVNNISGIVYTFLLN